MIRLILLVMLIAAAIVFGPRLHDRLQQFTLIDSGTGAVYVGIWEVLLEFAWVSGVLAAAVLVLALIVGFGVADLHGRFVLQRLEERLSDNYDNRELNRARDGRRVAEKQLAATRRRLKTERGQRAAYRRALRAAERERDRLRNAAFVERRRANGTALALQQLLHGRGAPGGRSGDPGPAPPAPPRLPSPPRGAPPSP